jgi:multidrug resistance efflux pump
MKLKLFAAILVFTGLFFIISCSTTQEITSSVRSTVSSITSTVDPALVNQIPADKREGFAKAEYDLKVATEKFNLAGLKSDLAGAQKKYVGYEEDLADSFRKEAELDYDLLKIEAISKSGLGKKDDNVKTKANLQQKKQNAQSNRIGIKANMENTKVKIENLTAQIVKMEESIKVMKFDGGKAKP